MSIVAKQVEVINDSFKTLRNLNSDLRSKLSEIDKTLDQLYHGVEHDSYGTVQAYKKLMEIQKLRRERRLVKHEIQRIASVAKFIENKDFLNHINQVYNTVTQKSEETLNWTGNWGIELNDILQYR